MAETFTIATADEANIHRSSRYCVALDAPLPLGYAHAMRRAAQLRRQDPTAWTWRAIAAVMGDYHGFHRSPSWWARELKGSGLVVDRRRGSQAQLRNARRILS